MLQGYVGVPLEGSFCCLVTTFSQGDFENHPSRINVYILIILGCPCYLVNGS